MLEQNKEEKILINLITNKKYKLEIETVCEIVKNIWSSEVRIVKEYTDHGYEHSQRIIQKIYEILKPNVQALTETELYFLLLGIYLHDIGMQCDIKKYKRIKDLAINTYSASFSQPYKDGTANSYTTDEQNEIRQNHHLLTGAWIEYSQNNSTVLSQFVNMIDKSYLDDLIKICTYHSKLSISDCIETSKFTSIRTKLIAALLRFGDELDIDKSRIHMETMDAFGYNTENAVFWYLHSRTNVTIIESEIKVNVLLNEEDDKNYSNCIDKIYIQSFKSKNKLLTDIISYNKINVFISEDSKVEVDRFQPNLPKEIGFRLNAMYKDLISAESKNNIDLLFNMSADDNQDEILNMLFGNHKNIDFMQKYKNEFITEAQNIELLINELKTDYYISNADVEKAVTIINSLRYGVKPNIFDENEDVFTNSYKIFLFVKAFTTGQLTYLSDIGIRIPIQVSSGQAHRFANDFFKLYIKYKNNTGLLEKLVQSHKLFDYYTFEQIERILHSYSSIINFNVNLIEFSNHYVFPSPTYGKLLAASICGESNKIFVWDVENKKREPIAALGGLVEYVTKVKIYRYNNQVIIAAKGIRQIYFWDLHLSKGEPTYILKSTEPISDYLIFKSLNGVIYTMGLVEKNICIWELYKNESPIACIPSEYNIYMIDTHLSTAEPTYECLGLKSFSDSEQPAIIELIEISDLKFNEELRLDIYSYIDAEQRSIDGYGNRINSYSIPSKGKEIFLLINNDIYIGDIYNSDMLNIANQLSQRVLHIKSISNNNKTYLLTNSIFQRYKKSVDLIHFYKLEDKKIVDHKHWALEERDVSYAAFSIVHQIPQIYFAYLFSSKIHKVQFGNNSCEEFYTLPDTFDIKDLTSE